MVKELWFTHYSPSIKDPLEYETVVRQIIPHVIIPVDGQKRYFGLWMKGNKMSVYHIVINPAGASGRTNECWDIIKKRTRYNWS